jgi:ferredoxin-NADP reductase
MAAEFVSGAFLTTLVSKKELGPGIVDLVFALKLPERLPFRAGQFVSLAVGRDRAGLEVRRSFSIASSALEADALRFIVRLVPDGPASTFLTTLPIGAEVPMTGPYGFFVLEKEHPGEVIFGATGTGVAAILPMLAELASRQPRQPTEGRDRREGGPRLLYWGARRAEDLIARPEVEALCARAGTTLHLCLTLPPPDWTGIRGRITPAILEAFVGWKAPTFYLVGNGAMIAELKRELVKRGVDRKKQIRTEAFFD